MINNFQNKFRIVAVAVALLMLLHIFIMVKLLLAGENIFALLVLLMLGFLAGLLRVLYKESRKIPTP
jgi:predicted ferric reductase